MLLLFSIVVALMGCEDGTYVCSSVYQPGIVITVKNENEEYVSDRVTAVVFEDQYLDTLRESSWKQSGELMSLAGAHERTGNYSLIITSEEFETYTDTNIIVNQDRCHVKTVELIVVLTPK